MNTGEIISTSSVVPTHSHSFYRLRTAGPGTRAESGRLNRSLALWWEESIRESLGGQGKSTNSCDKEPQKKFKAGGKDQR
jgi:hypothetical protein